MKNYDELLKNAPDHQLPAFIDYLKEHNEVVYENMDWLIIENCKYHTPEKPWYTAFLKWPGPNDANVVTFNEFLDRYPGMGLMVKPLAERTVKRFHIHIYTSQE